MSNAKRLSPRYWPAVGAAPLAAIFCLLAWATAHGPAPFDRPVLLALRDATDTSLPVGPAWLGMFLHGMTMAAASATLAVAGLFAAAVAAWRKRFGAAAFAVAALGGAIALGSVLKHLFARARPDIVRHLVETQTTSFPSGHAVNSAAACAMLCLLLAGVRDPRLRLGGRIAAVLFALLAGASRLYFGVHWPSDVLAGWCAGTAWVLLCAAIIPWRGQGPAATARSR